MASEPPMFVEIRTVSFIHYVPEFCVWELTLRCNMQCVHCGSRAGPARERT